MTTLAAHIAARNDADLLARFVAAAELLGVPDPQTWADMQKGSLVAQPISDTQKLSDVYAYAVETYSPVPRPGQDGTKVTDAHIMTAVRQVIGTPNSKSPNTEPAVSPETPTTETTP